MFSSTVKLFCSSVYMLCAGGVPAVWKLMRLISTGSVGWCGVISALLSRHFVRGSDSFLLRLKSNTDKIEEGGIQQRQCENL